MGNFARVADGREQWGPNRSVPRHGHDQGYAAIVLSGGYEECGSRGRFRVGPGDVLLHDRFDAHLNRFPPKGAQLLNLVASDLPRGVSAGCVDDPDAIVRAAERNPAEARAQLQAQLRDAKPAPDDWPNLLARHLIDHPDCRLDEWARWHGLAAETVSRGFGKVFGVTPAYFRLEARARRAFALIAGSTMPLASVAAAAGFADQAHMTRATRTLTGQPPSAWRRSNAFKTAGTNAG